MDTIDVPLLQADATVDEAIAQMVRANLAAVVVKRDDLLTLLFASVLGNAREQGIQTLRDIPSSDFEELGQPLAIAGAGIAGFFAPGPPSQSDERQWGLAGREFSAMQHSSTSALLISRTESVGALVRYRVQCEKNPSHLFPKPPLSPGSNCTKCVTTSGTPPKVR